MLVKGKQFLPLIRHRHVEFMMQHLMENNLEVINLFTVCNHQEMNN